MTSQTLAKINLDRFYADLETKYQQQERRVSAIDVDIFVNKVFGDNYVDEMADLIHKLRMTEEASNVLDSTSHALVRNLCENNELDFLLQILRDPLNYGVFLDQFTANLLLDKLVEEQKYTAAAEVASFLMLQEDFGDDISQSLSLLAAFKYLDDPQPFVVPEAPTPEQTSAAAAAPKAPVAKGKKGKKEELRVRVKFLRNAFFDDHFDLKEPLHLVGKTLVWLSAVLPQEFQASSRLLGLCLHEQFEEAVRFVEQLSREQVIYKEVLDAAEKALKANERDSEEYRSLLDKLRLVPERASLVAADRFAQDVVAKIKSAAVALEKQTIAEQEQRYQEWIAMRDARLADELLRLKRAASVREFEQIAKDMESEEKKLWFFENEEQIELEIESKEIR